MLDITKLSYVSRTVLSVGEVDIFEPNLIDIHGLESVFIKTNSRTEQIKYISRRVCFPAEINSEATPSRPEKKYFNKKRKKKLTDSDLLSISKEIFNKSGILHDKRSELKENKDTDLDTAPNKIDYISIVAITLESIDNESKKRHLEWTKELVEYKDPSTEWLNSYSITQESYYQLNGLLDKDTIDNLTSSHMSMSEEYALAITKLSGGCLANQSKTAMESILNQQTAFASAAQSLAFDKSGLLAKNTIDNFTRSYISMLESHTLASPASAYEALQQINYQPCIAELNGSYITQQLKANMESILSQQVACSSVTQSLAFSEDSIGNYRSALDSAALTGSVAVMDAMRESIHNSSLAGLGFSSFNLQQYTAIDSVTAQLDRLQHTAMNSVIAQKSASVPTAQSMLDEFPVASHMGLTFDAYAADNDSSTTSPIFNAQATLAEWEASRSDLPPPSKEAENSSSLSNRIVLDSPPRLLPPPPPPSIDLKAVAEENRKAYREPIEDLGRKMEAAIDNDNKKEEKGTKIAVIALVVSILTLFATIGPFLYSEFFKEPDLTKQHISNLQTDVNKVLSINKEVAQDIQSIQSELLKNKVDRYAISQKVDSLSTKVDQLQKTASARKKEVMPEPKPKPTIIE